MRDCSIGIPASFRVFYKKSKMAWSGPEKIQIIFLAGIDGESIGSET
jgi:hypothetical protein